MGFKEKRKSGSNKKKTLVVELRGVSKIRMFKTGKKENKLLVDDRIK